MVAHLLLVQLAADAAELVAFSTYPTPDFPVWKIRLLSSSAGMTVPRSTSPALSCAQSLGANSSVGCSWAFRWMTALPSSKSRRGVAVAARDVQRAVRRDDRTRGTPEAALAVGADGVLGERSGAVGGD